MSYVINAKIIHNDLVLKDTTLDVPAFYSESMILKELFLVLSELNTDALVSQLDKFALKGSISLKCNNIYSITLNRLKNMDDDFMDMMKKLT